MRLKIISGMFALMLSLSLFGQVDKLNGNLFLNVEEPSVYHYYKDGQLFIYWIYNKLTSNKVVKVSTYAYGFYDTCDLLHVDSLKQSGIYYFEIDPTIYEAGDNVERECGELEIYKEGDKTMMNIYYSTSQQYVTYMKVDALPERIRKYLKQKGLKVPKQ